MHLGSPKIDKIEKLYKTISFANFQLSDLHVV